MKVKLKKDIVIPAGTILDRSPNKTERFGDGHVGCTVYLTGNECASFEMHIDPNGSDVEILELVEFLD